MEFTLSWRELLIIVVLATAAYLLETLFVSRARRGAGEQELKDLRRELRDLRADLEALRNGSRGRVDDSAQMEQPAVTAGHSVYDDAVRFARDGMAPQEIAGRCGISRDEAALIVAMQRRGPTSP